MHATKAGKLCTPWSLIILLANLPCAQTERERDKARGIEKGRENEREREGDRERESGPSTW